MIAIAAGVITEIGLANTDSSPYAQHLSGLAAGYRSKRIRDQGEQIFEGVPRSDKDDHCQRQVCEIFAEIQDSDRPSQRSRSPQLPHAARAPHS
jgi:hypothetical protein